jgi:hypothetical protein
MGLHVYAISNIVTEHTDPELFEFQKLMAEEPESLYLNPDFMYHTQDYGSTPGQIEYYQTDDTETADMSCGSYSSYNKFRNLLSLAILGVKAETAWESGDTYVNSPLWDIINFSDCEGIIDTTTSSKLLQEFKDSREAFVKYIKADSEIGEMDSEHYIDLYDSFINVFEVASENGFVQYA